MSELETIKYSRQLFDKGYGCAEAVLISVAEFKNMKSDLIPRIASGFCGGIAKTNGMCGAVSGGVMAISMIHGRDTENDSQEIINSKIQKFIEEFKLAFHETGCTNLTRCDLSTKEGMEKFKANNLHMKCAGFVETATELTLNALKN
jgi:C_GCAxxG_C_C family probable redox protein